MYVEKNQLRRLHLVNIQIRVLKFFFRVLNTYEILLFEGSISNPDFRILYFQNTKIAFDRRKFEAFKFV